MFRYLTKRLISGILSFFIFTIFIFFTFNLLIPYDFVDTVSLQVAGTANREALREELGLTLPLWQQYANWMSEMVQGNFGREFTLFGSDTPIADLLITAVPATLLVFILGAIFAFWLGYTLGKISAWRSSRWVSGPVTAASIAFYTAFPPWLAFLLGFLLVTQFELLPVRAGNRQLSNRLWLGAPITPAQVIMVILGTIGLMLVVTWLLNRFIRRFRKRGLPGILLIIIFLVGVWLIWQISGYAAYALDMLTAASIPIITFILLGFGDTLLLTRTGMADIRNEMYVQTAIAKGLPTKVVRDKHMARNALLPVLSRFVINLPWLLTAVVIIEYATNWPGVGSLLFQSIYNQNTFVYMNILVIVGFISLIARLILDVIYAYLDPRIRFGEATI